MLRHCLLALCTALSPVTTVCFEGGGCTSFLRFEGHGVTWHVGVTRRQLLHYLVKVVTEEKDSF